jgi:Arc/MetJ-type ribon-helix-helix transcriptional regulator
MKRTTVSLPDDLARAVEREARRRDTSTSDVVRVALVAHLGLGTKRKSLPFINLGSSAGGEAIGRRMEELIEQEWTLDSHR